MLKYREGKGGSERDWKKQESRCQSTDLSSVIRGDWGMLSESWDEAP